MKNVNPKNESKRTLNQVRLAPWPCRVCNRLDENQYYFNHIICPYMTIILVSSH